MKKLLLFLVLSGISTISAVRAAEDERRVVHMPAQTQAGAYSAEATKAGAGAPTAPQTPTKPVTSSNIRKARRALASLVSKKILTSTELLKMLREFSEYKLTDYPDIFKDYRITKAKAPEVRALTVYELEAATNDLEEVQAWVTAYGTKDDNFRRLSESWINRWAAMGDADFIQRALRLKMNPNEKDIDAYTLLINAAANGHEDVVRLLVANPAVDLQAKNRFGFTAREKAEQQLGLTNNSDEQQSYTAIIKLIDDETAKRKQAAKDAKAEKERLRKEAEERNKQRKEAHARRVALRSLQTHQPQPVGAEAYFAEATKAEAGAGATAETEAAVEEQRQQRESAKVAALKAHEAERAGLNSSKQELLQQLITANGTGKLSKRQTDALKGKKIKGQVDWLQNELARVRFEKSKAEENNAYRAQLEQQRETARLQTEFAQHLEGILKIDDAAPTALGRTDIRMNDLYHLAQAREAGLSLAANVIGTE